MKNKKIGIVCVIVTILLVAAVWLRSFISQDRCLDSGGRWNSAEGTCEH
jgi:hypothetical protein